MLLQFSSQQSLKFQPMGWNWTRRNFRRDSIDRITRKLPLRSDGTDFLVGKWMNGTHLPIHTYLVSTFLCISCVTTFSMRLILSLESCYIRTYSKTLRIIFGVAPFVVHKILSLWRTHIYEIYTTLVYFSCFHFISFFSLFIFHWNKIGHIIAFTQINMAF